MRRVAFFIIGLALTASTMSVWRNRTARPAHRTSAPPVSVKTFASASDPGLRSIIELSGREGDGSSWKAVWCYLPRVRVRTVYTWQRNQAVQERVERIARGEHPPHDTTSSFGDEWAAINGGYFDWNRQDQPRRAIIGSVGNGKAGAWTHGSPPSSHGKRFQRWAFGMRQAANGETHFALALMQKRVGFIGYQVPAPIENAYPYGLSGLLCLMQGGKPMVWRDKAGLHALPTGQWNGRTEFRDGYFRRAALAWSADGRSLFMVIHNEPRSVLDTRDLFARYQGQHYVGAGAVIQALQKAFQHLPPAQRPCPLSALPQRIANAVMLDGGHCATLFYRRQQPGRSPQDWGSWQTGPPTRRESPRVPTTVEVMER